MPRVSAILINVTDIDKGVEFYTGKLGFRVASRKYYPQMVELEHEGAFLLLYKVDKLAHIDYPNEAQTLINFETGNLEAYMKELKARGVEVIHDSPQECPVGAYAAFRDPFGNVHELLELRG